MALTSAMTLHGTLELSDSEKKGIMSDFAHFVTANEPTLLQYFGHKLFPGSLNVYVPNPPSLQQELDAGTPAPLFVIPKDALEGMPVYVGDAQVWPCNLDSEKFPSTIHCWILRRVRSGVPRGVIEIVAVEPLVGPYRLQHDDPVSIEIFTPNAA